jgi:non-specific serine/threonine protein kinase
LHPLFIHGIAVAYGGDLATARESLGRMAALAESSEDLYYRIMAIFGQAFVEVQFGDTETAAAAASDGLRRSAEADARFGQAFFMEVLAWIAGREGDQPRAATLFGTAATMWEVIGASPQVQVNPHDQHLAATREALGDNRFDDLFATGRAMSEDQAVRYALGESAPRPAPSSTEEPEPLTRREVEIATMIATGLTNRDIATKLVIAPRTADKHVANILGKLGFHNRAQIAAWVTRWPSG